MQIGTSQSLELTRTKQELMQELTRTKQELMQELTRTKQELAQKVASQSQELTQVKQELTQKATSQDQKLELVKLKEAQRQAINRFQTQHQHDLRELRTDVEMRRDIVPVTIKVAGFDELKKKATDWYSRPFYTGVGGYKMCLICKNDVSCTLPRSCPHMTARRNGFTAHAHWEQQAEIRPFCAREMAGQAPSGNDDNGDKKPPRETKRTGYECEFVEPPQEQFQSECPICLQILREPYILDCCGYSFCAACIERVGKDGKPCPHCNQPGYTTLVNKGLKRALNEFRVYCPHRLSGCEWEGELGKLDEHLNSDPLPERQLKGCPFAVIECLHCKEGIRRDKIEGHQLERCPQRPYTCEYCAEYKSTFEDVAHSHWPECKCFLLPCPNECTPSGSGIQRQCLDQHVKEECPQTVVQCMLHHAGCEVTLPRKDMADHMKEDWTSHISLLASENCRLSKRLFEKEEQITQLEEKTTEQSQDLREKITSLSQELTRVKQELTQKATSQDQELEAKLEEAQRQAIDRLQTQQQRDLQELRTDVEMQRDIPPVTFKMAGFG